jgi:hypothetical protein
LVERVCLPIYMSVISCKVLPTNPFHQEKATLSTITLVSFSLTGTTRMEGTVGMVEVDGDMTDKLIGDKGCEKIVGAGCLEAWL